MTYEEAIHFWFDRVNYEQRIPQPDDLKLDRMRALLNLVRSPQKKFKIVHIAGSKGKGSTSAMLAAVLRRAGYRVGLFTSPHLVHVEERIQVDGEPISRDELASHMALIAAVSQGVLWQRLTFFEIATALGFLHFRARRVDVAVVEVGLGGRFDSTNVCQPFLSIITSISFDHMQQLGYTLASIAMEKAGIIKWKRMVVSGVRGDEARPVIEATCREREAPLRQVDRYYSYEHEPARIDAAGGSAMRVTVATMKRTWPKLGIALIGEHQAANAALAVAATEALEDLGLTIPERAVKLGLSNVHWPARLEIVSHRPLTILDCAHNLASAEALVEVMRVSFAPRGQGRRFLVFAGSRDKDVEGMLKVIGPQFDHIFLTRYSAGPRAMTPEESAALLPAGTAHSLHENSADALAQARLRASADDMIWIAGSVFLAGALRPLLVGR